MADLKEINHEIERLEGLDTTYPSCERLAILYSVRDHLQAPEENHFREPTKMIPYSYADEPQTEFSAAALSIPLDALMPILDEHFEAIRAVFPKEYDAVIRKIKRAGD